jgi:hypothetical protein
VSAADKALEEGGELLVDGATGLIEGGVDFAANLAMDAVTGVMEQTAAYTLNVAGGSLIAAAGALQAAAVALAASGFFHEGGVVMHRGGILTAHGGLNLAWDERLIRAQVGEGVVSRRGMAGLMSNYGPGSFERLNRGESVGGNISVAVQVNASGREMDSQSFWNRQAKYIRTALGRELSTGRKL